MKLSSDKNIIIVNNGYTFDVIKVFHLTIDELSGNFLLCGKRISEWSKIEQTHTNNNLGLAVISLSGKKYFFTTINDYKEMTVKSIYNRFSEVLQELWNGIYKGELQNINSIYDVLNYEIKTITIKDNYLEIVTSHHDGNNTYQLYFADYSLYDDESEKHYMDTVINLMELWEYGKLDG